MSTVSPTVTAAAAEISPSLSAAICANAVVSDLAQDKLHVLDDPLEWSAFSRADPQIEGRWESHVVIEGMHCAACALTIEEALMRVPGVARADVSAGSQRARVVWLSDVVQPSGWMHAVQKAGYQALPANDAFARDRRTAETRKALWRWAVAGLCMMQVMMYAYPAYVALPGDLSDEMERLLRWASWVLTLPVILFSCGPFFSSAWRDVLQRRVSMDLPVALGMLITFVVSTAGTFDPEGIFGHEVFFDSLTMFVFFLLSGRWLELRLRDKTAGALDALMNRLPDSVDRMGADGHFERVPVRRLLAGDIIRILPGETFPADGEVILGQTMVDEALLTGESRPVSRGVKGFVIAGSHNLASMVQVRVERTGDQTRFAEIVALMESASTTKPTLARLADRIAKPFLIAVLVAAALACAFWWERDPGRALMVAVAVLIVTCPCALSLATPAAMLAAAGALARHGIMVRRLDAFESLARVDTVIFDKTGTLTHDAMVLASTQVRDGITGPQALAMAAALARHSLHPVSRALTVAANSQSTGHWMAADVTEIPGSGVAGKVSHADKPTVSLRLGSPDFCGVSGPPPTTLQACLSDASGWVATFVLEENVRLDAKAAVASLQRMGIEVHLLSGDSTEAASRMAQRVGIEKFSADCSPQEKLDYVRLQQQNGRSIAVVGDGMNDGPVLAGAQVSFAFGQAVPLAQAKSDFVVLGAQLLVIPQSLQLARRTLQIVRQNLAWAAAYNAVCVPLAVVGWMPAWLAGIGMALSSLFVVLNSFRLSDTIGSRENPYELQGEN